MPQAEPGANQPATSYRGRLPGMAMGLVLGAAIALGMFFVGRALLARILDRRDVTISASTVVHSVQKLQRLETVVYTLDQIATGERDNPILPASLAGDRILLVVHGDVVAGIDLGKMHDSDITVHGRAVRLHLPQAEIFATRVDNQKTRVFSRDTGLFSAPDPRLESDVRQHAETQLRATAVQDGILNAARSNGESTLFALMRSLGFDQVDIE
jgi:hypothetical protein